MEIIAFLRILLLIASFLTFLLSLIFLLSPDLYVRFEEILTTDVIRRVEFFTALEGKVDILNDWIYQNRIISGLLFVLLSLYNIKSLILM